jgi:serine O-acetyltransferase
MKNEFVERLFEKHSVSEKYPSSYSITKFTNSVLEILFPALSKARKNYKSLDELSFDYENLRKELTKILSRIPNLDTSSESKADYFFNNLPGVYDLLNMDIDALVKGDPAAQNEFEVIRTYPGFYAIAFYRLAHLLHQDNVPLLPRVLTEYAHSRTGIDIHPAAEIGPYFFIDHGTGLVIGGTSKIGSSVKIYQGVTLGALSVSKEMAEIKRHPTIEDNVVIYAGATILGGETVIGHNSIIGGNVWLTKSIPPYSVVYHVAETDMRKGQESSSFLKK